MKYVKGDPLRFINIHPVAKYQKTRREDPFETVKKFLKVAQCRKKNPKEGPFRLVRFCRLP